MKKLLFSLCLSIFMMTAGPAWAITMTFDDPGPVRIGSYTEGAMTVVMPPNPDPGAHFFRTNETPAGVSDSPLDRYLGIHNGGGGERILFSLTDGGTFDVLSFDISTYGIKPDAVVEFVGNKGIARFITATSTKQIVTLSGPQWTNVSWFLMTMHTCSAGGCRVGEFQAAIDDFEYTINPTTVPEPTTLILMGSGLVAMLAFRKKIRKNA